jgi:hypothetical protein
MHCHILFPSDMTVVDRECFEFYLLLSPSKFEANRTQGNGRGRKYVFIMKCELHLGLN